MKKIKDALVYDVRMMIVRIMDKTREFFDVKPLLEWVPPLYVLASLLACFAGYRVYMLVYPRDFSMLHVVLPFIVAKLIMILVDWLISKTGYVFVGPMSMESFQMRIFRMFWLFEGLIPYSRDYVFPEIYDNLSYETVIPVVISAIAVMVGLLTVFYLITVFFSVDFCKREVVE